MTRVFLSIILTLALCGSVSAHMAKFRVEGPNDPGGIAGKNLVIQGATINADGSVTTN